MACGPSGASHQQEGTVGSASSSLTDLPAEEECSGTSRRPAADSEEDGFSYNEDDTESQEVGLLLWFTYLYAARHLSISLPIDIVREPVCLSVCLSVAASELSTSSLYYPCQVIMMPQYSSTQVREGHASAAPPA